MVHCRLNGGMEGIRSVVLPAWEVSYSSTVDPDYSSSGPLPFKWRYGGYTQCSASCLGGKL